jgi:hypothetical protein
MLTLVPLREVATVGGLSDLSGYLHLKRGEDEKHGTLKQPGGREASYHSKPKEMPKKAL